MSQIQQVCERINDTFVVKCVEQVRVIQEPIQVVVSQPPIPPESFWSFGFTDLINVVLVVFSLGLAWLGFYISKNAIKSANKATVVAKYANRLSQNNLKSSKDFNTKSVRPILVMRKGVFENDRILNFRLKNIGLGPAAIKSFQATFLGKKLDLGSQSRNELEEMFSFAKGFYGVEVNDSSYIGVNETIELLRVKLYTQEELDVLDKADDEESTSTALNSEDMHKMSAHTIFKLTYTDVYDSEIWDVGEVPLDTLITNN